MREMKDSGINWIGMIPTTWIVCRIQDVAVVERGGSPRPIEDFLTNDENGLNWIKIGDTDKNSKYIVGTAQRIRKEGLPKTRLVKEGTLLLTNSMSFGEAYILKIDGCIHDGWLAFSNYKSIIKEYLYYFLVSPLAEIQFRQQVAGGVVQNLNSDKVKKTAILLPPEKDQEQVVKYLDAKCSNIDAIIEKQQTIIEKLKEYKLSVITEAMTKGLDSGVVMKDSGVKFVKEIPCHWENRKMLSILSMRVVDGPHESPELFDEGIPYISATAIVDGAIDFSLKRGYISEEYCDVCDRRYKPKIDDILVVKLGASTGQVAIVDTNDRFNIWVPLAALRCNEVAIPKFVYYAFQSDYFIRQMELSWTYGTQQTLGVQTIERLRILLPPVDEQKRIVEYLDKKYKRLNNRIKDLGRMIEKLEEYKKAIIYEAVTGKKEI